MFHVPHLVKSVDIFNGRNNQGLGSKLPPTFARLRRSQIAFIYFDQAPSRSHHRSAQLVQQLQAVR